MSVYNPHGNQPPYPAGQPPAGQPPYPGSQAPYPGSQAPYPGSQAPYPGNQAPYPGGQPPYPGQSQVPGAQSPYPGQGQAPHPGQGYAPQIQSLGPPLSKIELKISCRNLLDLDMFSKSDPFVVVYMQKGNWSEIGRTETIENDLNPDFVKSFIVDYYFEEQQMMKFEVYDSDGTSRNLSDHDFLGRLVTSLGSIVGENGGKIDHALQTPSAKDRERNENYKKKSAGKIIVRSEEVSENKEQVHLSMLGKKLDKKDFFGKSDPFLVFERANEDNSMTVVHKTEVIKNTLNPTWRSFKISNQVLCNGDRHRTIRITCYDWDSDGSNDLIGSFETNLDSLANFKSNGKSFYNVISPKKKAKDKKYKNSGTIHITECTVKKEPTFLEYIRGGTQLNFMVAIDFTASNGAPSDPRSLHHNTSTRPSQYVQALQAVGGVLEDYDTDKLFPAFGFGAKIPPVNQVMHDFALNFNPQDPNCQGVNSIIGAYYHSINSVQLYGPTNFSPVIRKTIGIARENVSTNQYFVLMILTDGVITDMNNTKEAIIDASSLPISIIIVGVGNADFNAMDELDGDDVRVAIGSRRAERDIVQFVPFRDYVVGNDYDPRHGAQLAQQVLHELPGQLVSYFKGKGILPIA